METDQTSLFPISAASLSDSKKRQVGKYVSSIWSFPDSEETPLYRWYGTLPKPLVRRVIELYSPETVLDPFVGLGTTLDVAADLGIQALGLDTNPLGCLASEARLSGISSKERLSKELTRISSKLRGSLTQQASSGSRELDEFYAEEKYRYSRKWFRKDSLSALLSLFSEIADVEVEGIQRLLFVAAAQTVRDVALVDPRCTHHLVTKLKPYIDPVPLFVQAANSATRAVRDLPADPGRVRVDQGSLLDGTSVSGRYDFILIHPPYLGMIHYHLIHRLATDLLDFTQGSTMPSSLQQYAFDYEIHPRPCTNRGKNLRAWRQMRRHNRGSAIQRPSSPSRN